MIKQLTFILVICFSTYANSPLDINGADHQIVFWSFNHQFEKALNLVDEKIAENPSIPKYYFLKIVTLSLKHLSDSDTLSFEERYDFRKEKNLELIDYTENVLEQVEDVEMTPDNKFYLANIHGYLGRMHAFTGSHMSAFSNAKEGKDMLEELVEDYPELYDAYLLLGMFEYYADRLGGITEFAAAILGFSGNRETGLKYLRIAQQKGELTKPFAEFILGETYTFQEANNFAAAPYFEVLVKKYPNNGNFYEWYIRLLLQLDRLAEAKVLIENDTKKHVGNFVLGTFLLKNNEYNRAIEVLGEAVKNKSFKWRGAYHYSKYLIAAAALLDGEPIEQYVNELDEEHLSFYNELKDNFEAARMVMDFARSVGYLNVGEKMEVPQIVGLPEVGYLRSMYEFYNGVYYNRYRDATRAILFFEKVAKDREHFRSEAAGYLIQIYRSVQPTEKQLATLEDVIDDLDNEDLEFSFSDLRD